MTSLPVMIHAYLMHAHSAARHLTQVTGSQTATFLLLLVTPLTA